MKKLVLLFLLVASFLGAQNNSEFRVHSHNDYLQNVPFWKAISAGATSIEADVFLIDDVLYVAHAKEEIETERSYEKLYLKPLQRFLALGSKTSKQLQLLVDVKSRPYATLDALIKILQNYPEIKTNDSISIVISGNRPKPSEYVNYPDFIFFDHQSLELITDQSILKKIALLSLSFKDFSAWNGKGRLTVEDYNKVDSVIKRAHSFNKPFRFWATPDSKTSWKNFVHLGVDFINTDQPFECNQYLTTLSKREYINKDFSEVYRPTFTSDGNDDKVDNIILLIGDGNGLAQISATTLANNGELSLTQLKNIGFLKTQSSDDFTTDSASAGSAIATGHKVPNRAIGADADGNVLKNITEILSEKGFLSGIITSDQITGATPSAFYAHQKDRSMSEGIKADLLKSKLSVIVSKADEFSVGESTVGDFKMLNKITDLSTSKEDKISYLFPTSLAGVKSPDPLSKALKNTLNYLKSKNKPFFLMVEGAKIDSYGHENEIDGVIREGIAFDKAVSEALKFADTHKNTLVIVTADHETGGLTIPQGKASNNEIEGDFTTNDHTGMMVPIFAYGPQSNNFQGVYENNLLFNKMLEVLKVTNN